MTKCPDAPHCPGGEFCPGDIGDPSAAPSDWWTDDIVNTPPPGADPSEWYGSDN